MEISCPKTSHVNFCSSLPLAFRLTGQPGAKKRTTIIFQTVDFVWCPDDVLVATQKTRGQSLASIKARSHHPNKPLGIRHKKPLIGPNRWFFFGEILFKKRCLGKQGNQKRVGGQRSQISLWIKFVEQFRLISKDVFTFRLTCDA